MSSSREDSPDWLRSFQNPFHAVTNLSSDSEPCGDKSPTKDETDWEEEESISAFFAKSDATKKTTEKQGKSGDDQTPAKRRKTVKQSKIVSEDDEDVEKGTSDKQMESSAGNPLVWALSSDSECNSDAEVREKEADGKSHVHKFSESQKKEEQNGDVESEEKVSPKGKSPKKRVKTESVKQSEKKKSSDNVKIEGEDGDVDIREAGMTEKHVEPRVSSSTLPLVLPEKVYRSKALVECEGESIDLSGDMGAVGRVIIPDAPSKEPEMFLDLKGTIYKTTIVPSRTFCVVSIGQSEAKIEAIMNDFIQLEPQSNVYDAETMVEGTLDGFSFDSEDEADKMTKDVKGDQNEGAEENPTTKPKGKADKKLKAATQKKGKAAGGKQPKRRKPQAPKKGRTKK